MPFHTPWSPTTALPVLLSTTVLIVCALYVLAYPPKPRPLAFALLCLPWTYSFTHQLSLTPWFTLNDTFGRMLYIWLAYMNYAFLIVRVDPVASKETEKADGGPPGGGWREKLRWAGKVLYTRHLPSYYVPPSSSPSNEKKRIEGGESIMVERRRQPQHGYDRLHFCTHHILKALLFLSINYTWDHFIDTPSSYTPSSFSSMRASFLRRLPSSFDRDELMTRGMMVWDSCIGDMLYFSSIYSLFAVLFVGILRLDEPSEWDMNLFGSLGDCWSVRRYWGVYWHDYINASFSTHVKIVTRRWLGMQRGRVGTRLVENAAVFVVSGCMHSLVRFVQTEGSGEIWTVAIWYGAQILPIAVEGVVQHVWLKSGLRMGCRTWLGEGVVMRMGRAVGYVWVFAWMFWSVPKYLHTRHAWETENLRRKYPELFGRVVEDLKVTVDAGD